MAKKRLLIKINSTISLFLLLFGIVLQVPMSLITKVYAAPDVLVQASDQMTYIDFWAADLNSEVNITQIQYNVDGGSWTNLPAADGAYDSSGEGAILQYGDIPYGEHDIDVQAIDSAETIWDGPVTTVNHIQSVLNVTTNNFGGGIDITAESNDGQLTISSIDYRVDGGSWTQLLPNSAPYGDTQESTFINSTDIRSGTHTVDIRAVDNNSTSWPETPIQETLTNSDFITVNTQDNEFDVSIDALNDTCLADTGLRINNIQYRVDGGSWNSLPAGDGTYGDSNCHETATLSKDSVVTGEHSVDIRAIDQWTDNWPSPDGYTTLLVTGTGEAPIEDGQDTSHLAVFAGGGRTLSFNTNSDGTWVYMSTVISFITDYSVETYQSGTVTDTYLEYYGTDSSFTSLVSSDDNSGDGNYSKITFTPGAAGTYYFRARHVDPPSTDTFGIYSKPVNDQIENIITTTTSGVGQITIPAKTTGTNRFWAVQVSYRSNDYWVSGITLNDNFTFGCRSNSNEYKSEIWYLDNPTIGLENLVITFDGSNTVEDIIVSAVLFKGVDNGNAVADTTCNQAPGDPWSNTPSTTLDTTAGQIVFGGVATYESLNSLTVDAGLTEMWNSRSNNVIGAGAYKLATGASTSVSWAAAASWPWSAAGIALNVVAQGEPGTSADNPAEITTEGNVYNLDTNSDGTWVYLYANIPGAADYYTETYQSGTATDTYLEYYGTDSTFSTLVSDNDNWNDNYSHIQFTTAGAGNYYFRVKHATSTSTDNFGIRYNTYIEQCTLPIYSQGFEYAHVLGSTWTESDTDLAGYVGSEWGLYLTPNYGEATLSTDAYAYTGDGAFTMRSVGNYLTTGIMTLSLDMSAYQKMDDISLAFDYLWKDSYADSYDGLNIALKENSDQPAEVIATINNRTNIGSYHHFSVNLQPYFDVKPASTFQIILQWQGRKATASEESFTMDNIQVITGTAAACTSAIPTISFADAPAAHEGGRIVIAGTALSDDAHISLVDGTMTNNSITSTAIVVTDGVLSTESEDFTMSFSPTALGAYSIAITVTDTLGQTHTYNYSGSVDDIDVPVISVSNFGLLPSSDNTPTYTGSATDASSNITAVFYKIYSSEHGTEVDWTLATSTGDGFNSQNENFTFTTPALSDGVKYVIVEAIDSFGNYNYDTGDFVGNTVDQITIDAVDTSAPIVQVQEIIPNPTEDAEPVLQGKIRDDESEITSVLSNFWYRVDGGAWVEMNAYDGSINSIEEMFSVKLTGLSLGAHTVVVRASDASGNDTNNQSKNDTITFTIAAPGTYDSTNIIKTETFDTHSDEDLIGTDLIWGNGQVRLAETLDITPTTLSATGYGPRYGNFLGDMHIKPSAANGFWVTKDEGIFAFYSYTNSTETEFDIADYSPWGSVAIGDIEEYYVGGEYHVWVAGFYGVIGINFGASITDGLNDVSTYYETGETGTSLLEINKRGGADYGIFMNTTGDGVRYYEPNVFANMGDDETHDYDGAAGYLIDGATALYLEPDSNRLWVGTYGANGMTVIDDNNTPLYATDDVKLRHADVTGVFDFGEDKDGKIFFGGALGLQILLDDGGTFQNANDDVIQTLGTASDFGDNDVNRVIYNAGTAPTPDQFFVGTRSGNIKYLSTNGTYTDPLDDQIINLPVTGGFYPAIADDFYRIDDTHFIAVLERQGVILYTLTRDYVESGSALSEVDVTIEGRPSADFVRLDSVDVLLSAGGLSYEVSNDGGLTWYPITVGGLVKFGERDHRFKFRINMTHGSTPIVGGYQLTYAAYAANTRTLNLDVEDEPSEVDSGAVFGFTVKALDELLNPYDPDTSVTLELRKVSDNSIADSFNVSSAVIHSGEADITDAFAHVLGYYYIYASSGSASAASDPILFKGSAEHIVPSLSLTANKYIVKKGETVTLSWGSGALSSLVLSSDDVNYGFVSTRGTKDVVIDKETTFTLAGSGIYGSLTRSVTIQIEGDEVTEPPVIVVFDVTPIDDEKDKVLVEWEVDNVDSVTIIGVGENLPPKGSAEVYITKDTDFVLSAKNALGEVTQTKSVKFTDLSGLPETNGDQATLVSLIPLLTSLSLALFTAIFTSSGGIGAFFGGFIEKFGILIGIIIPRKKKYWGIIYDVKKNKGLPFAPVRLYLGNELVAQTVSDLNGKYGLLVDKAGNYTLKAESSGFENFNRDVKIGAVGGGYEIIEDIPMVRSNEKYSKFYQLAFYSRQEIISGFKALLLILMFVGFGYSAYITYKYPVLVNFIILAIYGVLFLANLIIAVRVRNAIGKVLDNGTKMPLAGVSIRMYDAGTQIGVYLTNSKGVVKMNVKQGNYWALVNKSGYEMMSDKGEKIVVLPGGYISKDILLKKSSTGGGATRKDATATTLAKVEELKIYKNPFGD